MTSEEEGGRTIFGQPVSQPSQVSQPKQADTEGYSAEQTVFGAPASKSAGRSLQPPAQIGLVGPTTAKTTRQRAGGSAGVGPSPNPLLAAATELLIFLGQLRTGRVEMESSLLRDQLVRDIECFVEAIQSLDIRNEDIEVARYAVVATANEVAQTIPGADPVYWQQFSLAADLLNDPMAGIGFFVRLDKAVERGGQSKDVLELMLTCLALGFEGKFRAQPKGATALLRLRHKTYHAFLSLGLRTNQDMSVHWTPIQWGGVRSAEKLPLWIFAGVAAAMVVIFFATVSGILSSDAQASQNAILALHDPAEVISLETKAGVLAPAPFVAPPSAQLDRMRDRLGPDIDAGLVILGTKGDFIVLRLGSQLQFKSGSADLASDFAPLAQRLGMVLEAEGGAIIVEGHSDNIRMGGGGRYKSNEALSSARAMTVLGVLDSFVSNSARLIAVGVGPNDPLDTANTAEARHKNRRVEILLVREARL